MKSLNTFIQEGSSKKCPAGQYYCFTDKKCKKIPGGYFVGRRGYLEKEEDSDDTKKNGKNGNGNGSSNGNGMVVMVMVMVETVEEMVAG